MLIALGATVGYTLIGFIDDWRKVYRNSGLSEHAKFAGVFLVGCTAAVVYSFCSPTSDRNYIVSGKICQSLTLSCVHTHLKGLRVPVLLKEILVSYYSWLIFLTLLTGCVGSATSICVDFSDGLDGLAGGLVFSASLAMGIVVASLVGQGPKGIVLEVLALLGAGAIIGYLPWNWPSAWAARKGKAARRAKIYMGDSGALGLGGLLAMIAIFSRNELLLLLIGGAFVLEGASAFISARVLVRIFRRRLQVLRFASSSEFVPHTDFPGPFWQPRSITTSIY